jgi:DNA-binding LytR/AlgR family response regulator
MADQFTIKCIITDDEPFARKGLQGYIEKIDFLELTGICEDALQLNNQLAKQRVDLIFLDIEMPFMSGVEFLKSFANPPKIIFTTAFEKYAVQGFELEVLDYLMKPISFERFLRSANKARDYFSSTPGSSRDHIFVKTDNKLEKIIFSEILFIEAMENYVAIYTGEKKIITHSTLKNMQSSLPSADFLQPHKSYIVNIKAIDSIEANILHIEKYQVPISKYLKDEVMERIVNSKLLKR